MRREFGLSLAVNLSAKTTKEFSFYIHKALLRHSSNTLRSRMLEPNQGLLNYVSN